MKDFEGEDWLSWQIYIWLATSVREQLTAAAMNFSSVSGFLSGRQASFTPADKSSHMGTEEHALSVFILQVMTEDEY